MASETLIIPVDPTKFDVGSSFDVHIGLNDDYADMLTAKMERDGFEVYRNDDGWEVWGESPNTNGNDANTHHVVVRVQQVQDAITTAVNIAKRYKSILTKMERQVAEDLNGIIVSVTHASNWDDKVLNIFENQYGLQTARFRSSDTHL